MEIKAGGGEGRRGGWRSVLKSSAGLDLASLGDPEQDRQEHGGPAHRCKHLDERKLPLSGKIKR